VVEYELFFFFSKYPVSENMDISSPFKRGLRVGDKPGVKSTEGLSRLPHSTILEPLYYFFSSFSSSSPCLFFFSILNLFFPPLSISFSLSLSLSPLLLLFLLLASFFWFSLKLFCMSKFEVMVTVKVKATHLFVAGEN